MGEHGLFGDATTARERLEGVAKPRSSKTVGREFLSRSQAEARDRDRRLPQFASKGPRQMLICGAEIAGNTIVLVFVDWAGDGWTIIQHEIRKIGLENPTDQADVRSFKETFENLMTGLEVETIAVKARNETGKFSGSGTSFKIEGLVQLTKGVEVILISPKTVAAIIKKHPVAIPNGLYKYQHEAFKVAYCHIKRLQDWQALSSG